MQTKSEMAKHKGLKIFDCALPQQWLNDIANTISEYSKCCGMNYNQAYDTILCGVVWCYDGSLLGYPFALTSKAQSTIEAYNQIRKYENRKGMKQS